MLNHLKKILTYALLTLCVPMGAFAQKSESTPIDVSSIAAGSKMFFFESSQGITISAGRLVVHGKGHQIGWTCKNSNPSKAHTGGMLTSEQFYQMAWSTKDSPFNIKHPNAVILGALSDGTKVHFTTTLTGASYDTKNSTITYTMTKPIDLNGNKPQGDSFVLSHAHLSIDSMSIGSSLISR